MQLGSMFISNYNNTLHVSNAFSVHKQEHLKTVEALSAEDIDLGRPYWILHPVSCHTPEAVTTVLSAPEDGRKKRSKHVEYYCSY